LNFRDYILSAIRRNERPVERLLPILYAAVVGQNIQFEPEIAHRSDPALNSISPDHFDAQFRSTGRYILRDDS
jgi:hypothetical protein